MNLKKQTRHKLGAVFFAIFLLLNTLFSALFLHVHELPSGQFTIHSHATRHNSQNSNHTHTNLEYLVYFLISVVNYFLLIIFIFRVLLKIISTLKNFRSDFLFSLFDFLQSLRRAPPLNTISLISF